MAVATMLFCGHKWFVLNVIGHRPDWEYRDEVARIRESYSFVNCLTPYKGDDFHVTKILFMSLEDAVMFRLLSEWQLETEPI